MVKILLPNKLALSLQTELEKACDSEIGGILMGQHVSENTFRIVDFTVQTQGGSVASFIRSLNHRILKPLREFFRLHNHQYTKFNYLGEWHSHPLFSLAPSIPDKSTMWDIINDPVVGANFVILLIVKLKNKQLKGSVNVFLPGYKSVVGTLELEVKD